MIESLVTRSPQFSNSSIFWMQTSLHRTSILSFQNWCNESTDMSCHEWVAMRMDKYSVSARIDSNKLFSTDNLSWIDIQSVYLSYPFFVFNVLHSYCHSFSSSVIYTALTWIQSYVTFIQTCVFSYRVQNIGLCGAGGNEATLQLLGNTHNETCIPDRYYYWLQEISPCSLFSNAFHCKLCISSLLCSALWHQVVS
jgi:hypothetical protein